MSEVSTIDRPHVVVIGMMGVGKSTLGRALAEATGRRYVDSDEDIARLFGASGSSIAEQYGVEQLHVIEAGLLYGALAQSQPSVTTAAASVVEREPIRRAAAERARVVWVTAGLDETIERQRSGDHRRPMSREELARLTERRRPFFEAMADVVVAADRDPELLVHEVLEAFRRLPD